VRYKGVPRKLPEVRNLDAGARQRILDGEPWLRVWSQRLCVPLDTMMRKTGLSMARLIDIEAERDQPTADELELIATALGTTVDRIEDVQD
jgi:transcriptional regulator with XRE-family HTH domain